jgi:hypothetical protein
VHFSTKISYFSCPWIRIRDPDSPYGSGSIKSLNPDPIRIRIHNPAIFIASDKIFSNLFYFNFEPPQQLQGDLQVSDKERQAQNEATFKVGSSVADPGCFIPDP